MTRSGDEHQSKSELLQELESLRQKNARLEAEITAKQHLYQQGPAGLCYFDKDLRYIHINDWLAEINGVPASEHLGRTIAEILPDAAAVELERQLRFVIESGEPIIKGSVYTETAAHPGVKRTYEHNYIPHRSSDGTIAGVSCVIEDVTDRIEADQTLERSEELYRTLLDTAPQIIWQGEVDGAVSYLNKAWEEMTGIAVKDALGWGWTDVVHPDDVPGLLAKWEEAYKHGEPYSGECRFRAKDGSYRTIDFVGAPVRDQSGEVIRWVGIDTDITGRKQAEVDLDVANRRLEAVARTGKLATTSVHLPEVLDAILGGTMDAVAADAGVIFLRDPTTGLLTVAATKGVDEESRTIMAQKVAAGSNDGLVGHIVATGQSLYIAENAAQDPRSIGQEMNSFIGVPIHAEDELLGVLTLSSRRGKHLDQRDRDLVTTAVSQVNLAIRNARFFGEHARLRAAIEQASEVITITDIQGVMQYVNPAFEWVTGYSREEAIGEKPSILKSGRHGPEHYRDLWETITNGDVWVGRFVNRRRDGTLWEAESTITPVRNSRGEIDGFVEVKRDISEQVSLRTQLRQAQTMEALGRLAGGVAHDFNNLLTVIEGCSDLLMGETAGYGSMHDGLGAIRRAAERAADLTRRLLLFSRDQPADPVTLSIDDAVRGVEPMLRRLIRADVELHLMLDSAPWTVEIDPAQLEQVIISLVVNACDAMPSGGQLMIETRRCGDAGGVAAGSDAGTDSVELTLRDSGFGMDADTVEHIFEPFYTTKDDGTGLGLSIVHGIVTKSGGRVAVTSEPGAGTSFNIVWPRTVAGKLEGQVNTESGSPVERGKETVLVVDDDSGVRDFMMEVLSRYGYSVVGARTASEALEIFAGRSEEIRLLVTDVVLP